MKNLEKNNANVSLVLVVLSIVIIAAIGIMNNYMLSNINEIDDVHVVSSNVSKQEIADVSAKKDINEKEAGEQVELETDKLVQTDILGRQVKKETKRRRFDRAERSVGKIVYDAPTPRNAPLLQ